MALYGMPFLVLNYGVEMVFVLQTRFISQKVSEKMRSTMLSEFAQVFLNSSFMDEMFRPQLMYSYISTRELFMSLAQSTILRLSNTSLNKLFGLTTMGLKYQLFTIRHPIELVEMTFHHLEELQDILGSEGQKYICPVFVRLRHLVSQLLIGDLAEIRRQLLNLLLVRNVPVSVLLENNRQQSDGSFVIPRDRYLSPCPHYEAPGTIRYYNEECVEKVATFTHRDADLSFPPFVNSESWDPTNPATRLTRNNVNVYTSRVDSLALFSDERPRPKASFSRDSAVRPEGHSSGFSPAASHAAGAIMGELNYLSKFVEGAYGERHSRQTEQQSLKLNLFDVNKNREHEMRLLPRGTSVENHSAFPHSSDDAVPHMSHKKEEKITQIRDFQGVVSGVGTRNDTVNNSGRASDLLDIMDED